MAKLNERIAEIYLTDMADLERAMNHFEHSADWHKVSMTLSMTSGSISSRSVIVREKKVGHPSGDAC